MKEYFFAFYINCASMNTCITPFVRLSTFLKSQFFFFLTPLCLVSEVITARLMLTLRGSSNRYIGSSDLLPIQPCPKTSPRRSGSKLKRWCPCICSLLKRLATIRLDHGIPIRLVRSQSISSKASISSVVLFRVQYCYYCENFNGLRLCHGRLIERAFACPVRCLNIFE